MRTQRPAQPTRPATRYGECFVIIPYRRRFEPVYRAIEKTLTGAPLHFDCQRAKDISGGGQIMTDVWKGIEEAEVVIADLTGSNPNVFYELGVAHALRPPDKTILLAQSVQKVPFDVTNYRTIQYQLGRSHPRGRDSLSKRLLKEVQAVTERVHEVVIRADVHGAIEGHKVLEDEKLPGLDGAQYSFVLKVEWYGQDHMVFDLIPKKYKLDRYPRRGRPIRCELRKREVCDIPNVAYGIRLESSSPGTATFKFIHK